MINSLPPYILYLLAVAASFAVSLYAVRKIIFITKARKIFDIPDNIRKIHGAQIPSLGGIGVFTAYIVTAAFFMFSDNTGWNYILISSVILFFTGIYDDLMNMRPLKKLAAQLLASAITVYFTLMPLITNGEGPARHVVLYWALFFVITVLCTFFINAFNFIDGIDGLACSMAILYSLCLGILFLGDQPNTSGILFSLMGATGGLLFYNRAPAKIYMGDTGSMFLGFNIFIFALIYSIGKWHGPYHEGNADSVLALSILFLPAYDAIRVFMLRLSRGVSPLKADRTHLHYYLLDAGFTHTQAVMIILFLNLAIIVVACVMRDMVPLAVIAAMTILASVVLYVIYKLRQKKLSMRSQ